VLPGLAEIFDLLRVETGAGSLCAWQDTRDVAGDVEFLIEVVRAGVGLLGLAEAEIERLVDHHPATGLVPVDESDGHT
jgi:hypothetical protein